MLALAYNLLNSTLLITTLCTVSKSVLMSQESPAGAIFPLLPALLFAMGQHGVIIRQEYLFVFLSVLNTQLLFGLTMVQAINQSCYV